MTVEKSELRAAALYEVGVRIDDFFEASQTAASNAEGAATALQQAAEVVKQLHEHVDRELAAGTIADLSQAEVAKLWVTRSVLVLEQLAANASLQKTMQKGFSQGVQRTVLFVKHAHEQELTQAAQRRQEQHHESTLKQQRTSVAEAPTNETPSNGAKPRRRRKVQDAAHS